MRKTIIPILIFLLSINICANEKISQILGKYTNSPVEIDFELKTYWEVREKETKVKGKIVLAPENKFNISMGKMNYVSDGKTFWEYNSRQKQVKIEKIKNGLSTSIPTELLKLLKNAEFIEKSSGFAIWQDNNSRKNGFEKVEIHHNNSLVSKIIITDTDKNITTYTFEKVVFLPKVDENLFNFIIPSGAQVYEN